MATATTPDGTTPRLNDRSLYALAALNFFLADARDGLGPFLDAYLATHGWSSLALGWIATVGGLLGLFVTPLIGALVDNSTWKRTLIAVPVVFVTAAALLTLAAPNPTVVWIGQIGTALVGAAVGPALAGLTLGLVGERMFGRQVSRDEFWNHSGNVVSLVAVLSGRVDVRRIGDDRVDDRDRASARWSATAAIDPKRHRPPRRVAGSATMRASPGRRAMRVAARATRGLLLVAIILLHLPLRQCADEPADRAAILDRARHPVPDDRD